MQIVLPVTYSYCGTVTVEADSIEDAINFFNENCDEIDLPANAEYVSGSFELCSDDVEWIEFINKTRG